MRSRSLTSLAAGAVAIAINTALLSLADAIHFTTARGGLLRLVRNGAGVRTGFHIVIGLLMALFYAHVLERRLPGGALMKGLAYALGVWLLNAFIVLPLLDEGLAGSLYLSFAGVLGFAAIHTVFFVLLAVLCQRWRGMPGRHQVSIN